MDKEATTKWGRDPKTGKPGKATEPKEASKPGTPE